MRIININIIIKYNDKLLKYNRFEIIIMTLVIIGRPMIENLFC